MVVFLYFVLPGRYRWILLLISSYFFYMYWKVEYILLIVLSTLVDYFAGLKMSAIEDKRKRRPFLILSILSNLGILFTFKYFNFFSDSVNTVLELLHVSYAIPAVSLLLPIGISFYTFQTMSYSIDIYKGKITAEKNLGIFALYVTYFPQLVAGPIERSSNLIPQLRGSYDFDYKRVTDGLKLMAWGFSRKWSLLIRWLPWSITYGTTLLSLVGCPLFLPVGFSPTRSIVIFQATQTLPLALPGSWALTSWSTSGGPTWPKASLNYGPDGTFH